jgi:WD40 repeat protein
LGQPQAAGNAVVFTPDGDYIAVGTPSSSGYIVLLNHTTPGSVSLAATYNVGSANIGVGAIDFSPDGNYLATTGILGGVSTIGFTLLNHTVAGSLSLAATYNLANSGGVSFGNGTKFSPDGDYIVVTGGVSPYVTLLNHTTPGSVSLATTYTASSTSFGCAYSVDGNYIAFGSISDPHITILDSSTPGSLSLVTTYTLTGGGQGVEFFSNDEYLATCHGTAPCFTLLSFNGASLTLAATYTIAGSQGSRLSCSNAI